ncbi:MAG: transketolase-like TK C-terminal-containing protein, partial [Telluria sp.]
ERVQLVGSGTILRESIFAAELLMKDWGVAADIWSAPSLTLVARDGQDAERWNLVNPTKAPRVPFVTALLENTKGPIIATTDYMRMFAEQIRAFMPKNRTYRVLGTDGFGRSDSRVKLREFFEVNRYYITVAALKSLAEEGKIDASVVADAVAKYGIDPNKPNPVTQ